MQVARCTKIINADKEDAKYMINLKPVRGQRCHTATLLPSQCAHHALLCRRTVVRPLCTATHLYTGGLYPPYHTPSRWHSLADDTSRAHHAPFASLAHHAPS